MLLRKPLFIVALIAIGPASASRVVLAQNGRCPAITKGTPFHLNSVAQVFERDGWSEARKYLKIEKVPASAIREEIVDDSVCQALYRATEKALPKVFEIKPEQAHFFFESKKLFYFRIGDYYAVLPLSNQSARGDAIQFIYAVLPLPNQPVRNYTNLFIFRDDDLKYVGSVLM